MALVATGGYGRGELFPCSDVDVLVLLRGASRRGASASALERLIGMFWDIGLEIGHSVRTVEACVETARRRHHHPDHPARGAPARRQPAPVPAPAGGASSESLDPAALPQGEEARAGAAPRQAPRHALRARAQPQGSARRPARPAGDPLDRAGAAASARSWRDLAAPRPARSTAKRGSLARHEALLQDLRIRLHYLAGRREDRIAVRLPGRARRAVRLRDTAARGARASS